MADKPQEDPHELIKAAAAAPKDAPDLRTPRKRKTKPKDDPEENERHSDADEWDQMGLPEEAPVQPLGTLAGTMYVLDYAGQLRPVAPECRNGEMQLLFGGDRWLRSTYPLYGPPDKDGNFVIKGFNHKLAQTALIRSCARLGLFNPAGKTRGRGAHRGPNGELMMHCGDVVWRSAWRVNNRMHPPREFATGKVGALIFPTDEELPPPAQIPAGTDVAESLLALINEWRWTDPIMAELVFSWIICAPVGGGLEWRPHLWIVGPSGAGKTTLQVRLIREIVGAWGISTEDATEAGLRQSLNQDTLAVMFDEFEPDENNAVLMQKVLKLVRGASSGSETVRGSTDHKAAKFVAKSCFLFSSIQYVAMDEQDRNRMAIVQLSKIPKNKEKIKLPATLATWGGQLRRRWLEQWPRWADTLQAYQHEMYMQGFSPREQDTYGTLLAASDIMLFDDTPDPLNLAEESYRVRERVLALGPLLDKSRGEAEDSSTRCIRHLCSYRLPSAGGKDQLMISRWIELAIEDVLTGISNGSAAMQKLAQHGLRIVTPPAEPTSESAGAAPMQSDRPENLHVAIAPKDFRGMGEIFDRTGWQNGVWTQSLASLPGARVGKKCRFGGGKGGMRSVTVPIEEFIDLNEVKANAARKIEDRPRE